MNKLNKIKKLLEKNFNFKGNYYKYFPKTNIELKQLVKNLIYQYGSKVDLNNINVSNIIYFNNIFKYKNYFEGDVSEWNVSNGLYFDYMFSDCKEFNCNLSKWNVFNSKDFNNMFYKCKSFNADLSRWNVSNATDWNDFALYSLLSKYPENIPQKFKNYQL